MAAPTIITITKVIINPGQTLGLTGINFGASGAKLWLADADDFGAANKVEFYVVSHDDTNMIATVTPGSFGDGPYFLFVENSGAETNAAGEAISLVVSEQKKFFGQNVVTTTQAGANIHYLSHYISSYTGKLTSISQYSVIAGNVKVSLYDTTGTNPVNLLYTDDTGKSVPSAGFTVWDVPKVDVSSGVKYAIGNNSDTLGSTSFPASGTADRTYKAATYAGFTAPDPLGVGYTYNAGSTFQANIAAYGYALPTISSIDKSTVADGQILNAIGNDFMSSGLKVYLADADNFATATKVEATVISHTNSTLSFTVNAGAFTPGIYYIFVETDLGLVNSSGQSVVLTDTNVYGFRAELVTTSPAESVILPFVTGQTYACWVNWGDGSNPVYVTAWDDVDATHAYALAGTYTIEVTGQADGWSVSNSVSSRLKWRRVISWGDDEAFDGFIFTTGLFYNCPNFYSIPTGGIKLKPAATTANSLFHACPLLSSIPQDLFVNFGNITTAINVFLGCTAITVIPAGLLDPLVNAILIGAMFYGCSITTVPVDLFKYCTKVTSFTYMFTSCSILRTIPKHLFKYNLAATDFSYAFQGCYRLQLRADMFFGYGEQGTRFLNKSVNFTACFNMVSAFAGTKGHAPPLWACSYGTGTPTTTNCFNAHSLSSIVNYNNIQAAWGGTGYVDTVPVITNVTPSVLYEGRLINAVGTDFETTGGELWLCKDVDYQTSIKREQTIDSQSDIHCDFIVSRSSLRDGATYIYYFDSDQQMNDFPYLIYLGGDDVANDGMFFGDGELLNGTIVASCLYGDGIKIES